jgi:hypothetical protein
VKALLALATLLPLATPFPAFADEVSECESLAAFDFPKESRNSRLHIDRAAVNVDKAEVKAGKEYVSSVLHGPATLEASSGSTRVRFVCLYGGVGVGPLFVWLLPD